jgi:hypothetical protein
MSPWRMALPAASLGAAFALAAAVEPWYQTWAGTVARQGNALQMLLGDSRRMFANHFYVKADAYFHSGYYPSVFDNRESFQTAHMAADAGAQEEKNTGDEHAFLGEPQDWIDAFSRHLFPSRHTHLDEGGTHGGPTGPPAMTTTHAADGRRPAGDPALAAHVRGARPASGGELRGGRLLAARAHAPRGRGGAVPARRAARQSPQLRDPLRARAAARSRAVATRRAPASCWDLAYQPLAARRRPQARRSRDLFMLRNILSYRALLEEQEGHVAEAIRQLKVAREVLSGGLAHLRSAHRAAARKQRHPAAAHPFPPASL